MLSLVGTIIGGIGLFLLGMSLMGDGLRAVAGDALRKLLHRWTRTKLSSVATGTAITALIQSSSATTLATIGFVSAGLMTLTQATGVVLGANLGTTMTSWLVALVGLKFDVSTVALPIVGVGALLRLLGRGRRSHIGSILAGFGLVFVGIDFLQAGMMTFSEGFSPAQFAVDGLAGRLLLVFVGIVMTVLTQSSSAAIATTLAAASSGAIDMDQAAALVVGQNIGTTVTAAMGSIGATIPAKRTALAHALFNGLTGVVAFFILPVFLDLVLWVSGGGMDAATTIAIFHTAFNILGVGLVLPFLDPFTDLVVRMVPGPKRRFTSGLDESVRMVPTIALDAASNAVAEMFSALAAAIAKPLNDPGQQITITRLRPDLEQAIETTKDFLRGVETSPSDEEEFDRHVGALHALDHLGRCLRWAEETDNYRIVRTNDELDEPRELLTRELAIAREWFDRGDFSVSSEAIAELSQALTDTRQQVRSRLIQRAAAERIEVHREQHALNWLSRIGYHIWRAAHHLGGHASPPDEVHEP